MNNNMRFPPILRTPKVLSGLGLFKYSFAISPTNSTSSSSFSSLDASPMGCVGGNVIACGRFSIPSLIGLSPSVISLVVAFCVSVIGL